MADKIPGAPGWVNEFLGRVDERFDVLNETLTIYVNEVRSYRSRIAELEAHAEKSRDRHAKQRASIQQLYAYVRSTTPPNGTPMPELDLGPEPDDDDEE